MRWIINIVTNYLKFFINIAVVLFMTPYVAGKLGIDLFGMWSLLLALFFAFSALDFGFSIAGVKYVGEYYGKRDFDGLNHVVSTLMVIYLGLTLFCLILVTMIAQFLPEWLQIPPTEQEAFTRGFLILGCIMAFNFPASIYRSVLLGIGRMDLTNAADLTMALINAAIIYTILEQGYSITAMAISHGTAQLAMSAVLIPVVHRQIPGFKLSFKLFSKQEIYQLSSYSWFAFLGNVSTVIMLRMDPVIIKSYLPLAAVALYAIASKVGEYAFTLNKQFANALAPMVAQSYGRGDGDRIKMVLLEGTRLQLGVSLPILALLYFHAPTFIEAWMGSEYLDSVPVLRILVLGVVCATIQLNPASVLIMTSRIRFVGYAGVAAALLNLIISIILVKVWGLEGVATGTLITAFTLQMLLICYTACRQEGVSLWQFTRKGILSSIPALLPTLLLAYELRAWLGIDGLGDIFLQSAICGFVYLFLFLFTAISKDERKRTWAFIQSKRSKS